MDELQQQRAIELLKATVQMLNKIDRSPYVVSPFETVITYDDAECDGYCLRDDINYLLDWIKEK